MRLLKREPSGGLNTQHCFSLTEFRSSDIPSIYAILSHRWGDDEVSFKDLESGTAQTKSGYRKLEFCAEQAHHDGIVYFWIDTCCIDKANNTELSEAINSMFKWYQNATKCYVYLQDVSAKDHTNNTSSDYPWISEFQASTWFTRGWTLQELIAPKVVEFFSGEGERLGDKTLLEQQLHRITKLPIEALRGSPLSSFNVEERFDWATKRCTTIEEDAAYCLLGIFDIQMPLLYGEGKQKALDRLRRKVEKFSNSTTFHSTTTISTVPFERNSRFTGREAELARMEDQLFAQDHTSRWAITGLGGVGKTQLVLELLYRTAAKYQACTIMWIPSTNNETLYQGYSAVARQLNIAGSGKGDVDLQTLVQNYLSKVEAGPWVLVFDNADDINLWTAVPTSHNHEQGSKSTTQTCRLIDRLPQNKRGCILFTTRDRKLATKVAGPNILSLSEMHEEMAMDLLGKYLGTSVFMVEGQRHAEKLVAELTYLPLAIVQAATYINENSVTVAEYLSLLQEQEEEVIDLLSQDFEDQGRYRNVKNPIATTWLISFEQIQKHDQLAAEYLSFMACVHPKDIPRALLPEGSPKRREVEAVGTLVAYSFVSRNLENDTLTLHRLVHLATRNWLRRKVVFGLWLEKASLRLELLFPNHNYQNRVLWRTYLPHVMQVIGSDGFRELESGGCENRLVFRCGTCLYMDGRWDEAENFFKMLVTLENCSNDSLSVLASKSWLAATYGQQRRWEEGKVLEMQVAEAFKRKLGSNHPKTLTSLLNLATMYWNLKQLQEAEELQLQVKELSTAKLGPEHPCTLRSMANLATTYRTQERWEQAEELQEEALRIRKITLGIKHPDTMRNMANLAETYANHGRLQEAETLGVQALAIRKAELGASHPDTMISMYNLACTWKHMGRLADAIQMMDECARRRIDVFGVQNHLSMKSTESLRKWEVERSQMNELAF